MDQLDDKQKQFAREALQHFKNGLDAARKLEQEFPANAADGNTNAANSNNEPGNRGDDMRRGIEQIEAGLRQLRDGMKVAQDFDPTPELQDASQNSYEAGTGRPANPPSKFA